MELIYASVIVTNLIWFALGYSVGRRMTVNAICRIVRARVGK
jgi:hypothetical protein